MTGLDLLREKLIEKGATKVQIQSKLVAIMLDVMSEAGTENLEIWKNEQAKSKYLKEIENDIDWNERRLAAMRMEISTLERRKEFFIEASKKACDYIDAFNDSLKECETAEGRDAMRKLQIFVNTVDRETPGEKMMFSAGVAAILSGGELNPLEEVRKISADSFKEQTEPTRRWRRG